MQQVAVSYRLSRTALAAVSIPSLAVAVRRLHDTGRSGWWLLLYLIPVLGWIALLVFFFTDSHRGTNEHGPSPKYGG